MAGYRVRIDIDVAFAATPEEAVKAALARLQKQPRPEIEVFSLDGSGCSYWVDPDAQELRLNG